MICPVEIASDVAAGQAARVGEHGGHVLLHAGREGADDEGTGSDFAGHGEEDHVVAGGEQALEPFTVMLSIMLMGSVLSFLNVLLVRRNRCDESPLETSVPSFCAVADRENDDSKSTRQPICSFMCRFPPLLEHLLFPDPNRPW